MRSSVLVIASRSCRLNFRSALSLLAFFVVLCPVRAHSQARHIDGLKLFGEALRSQDSLLRAQRDSIARERGLRVTEHLDGGVTVYLERFINGEPYYLVFNNAVASKAIGTDDARQHYGLDGAGILIGLWDFAAVETAHPEIAGGRVQQMDGAPLDTTNDHATHVAGTLVAIGLNPLAKGMAPASTVHAYDVRGGDTFRMLQEIRSNDMHLSNHSYGLACGWIKGKWYGNANIHPTIDYKFGYYDLKARDWDSVAVNAPTYLIVKAAGNFRGDGGPMQPPPSGMPENNGGKTGYDCIPAYGVAKNILTVGAIDGARDNRMTTFSAWGPADDGRIKPDLVAHGEAVYSCSWLAPLNKPNGYATNSGTSQAAPSVTGSIALLMQLQQRLHPGSWLRSSTIKALLLHTADDLGAPGPDYQHGWGLMNTRRVAELMERDRDCGSMIFDSLALDETAPVIRRTVRSDGDTLKATICWTDPPAEPLPLDTAVTNNPARRLVNDLDLRIISARDTTYPWVLDGPSDPAALAHPGDNVLDNVEQVLIPVPAAGAAYDIEITRKGKLARPQSVSLVVTGNCTAVAELGPDRSVCSDQPFTLTASIRCGAAPVRFTWSTGDSLFDGSGSESISISNAGVVPVSRTVLVTVTDARGCTATDSVRVTVRPMLVVSVVGTGVICGGDSVRLQGRISGGTPPYAIAWSPSAGLDDPTRLDPVARPQSTTSYVLTVTDSAGCSMTSSPVLIRVSPAPPVPLVFLAGDTLVSTPAYAYQWELNGAPIAGAISRTKYPLEGGSYTVVTADTNGCASRSLPFPFGVCTVELVAPDAAPGERVPVRLLLTRATYLAAAGAQTFTAAIRLGTSLLTPVEMTPSGVVTDSTRILNVSGSYVDGVTELFELPFRAMLGDRPTEPLHLDRFSWNVPNIRTSSVDGEFHLVICREGGPRLFSGTPPLKLAQNHPNPFNATTAVEFSVIERGPAELAVFDLLGRAVAVLIAGEIEPGQRRIVFDAGPLPSGFYLLSLRASGQRRTRMMQVLK